LDGVKWPEIRRFLVKLAARERTEHKKTHLVVVKFSAMGITSARLEITLDYSVTHKYELVWDEELRAAVVDLNKVHSLGRGSRKDK